MRLLVNTTPLLFPKAGIARYTEHVVRALSTLAPHFQVWFLQGGFLIPPSDSRNGHDAPPSLSSSVGALQTFCHNAAFLFREMPFVHSHFLYHTSLMASFQQRLLRQSFDVYFEPNFIPTVYLHARRRIAAVHDLSVLLHPQWHPRYRVEYFRRHFLRALPAVELFVTGSQATQREMVSRLQIPAGKICVIPYGVDHARFHPLSAEILVRFRRQQKLPEKFILYVGTLEPRKNVEGLVQAYLSSEKLRRDFSLVLVGQWGWKYDSLLETVRRSSCSDKILFRGYVPDQDLPLYYNSARLFVYPSFYEGFGLPLLEAMACGAPVVASNRSAIPEVAGEAAFLVDPSDGKALTRAMETLCVNRSLARGYIQAGFQRAKAFSWEKTTQGLLRIFGEEASFKGIVNGYIGF